MNHNILYYYFKNKELISKYKSIYLQCKTKDKVCYCIFRHPPELLFD